MFTLAEQLFLGGGATLAAGDAASVDLNAWGMSALSTAGCLCTRMAPPGRDVLLLASQATRLSAEIERRIGFAQVVEERFPALRVVRIAPDLPADDAGAAKALAKFLKKSADATRIGAGAGGVAD